MKPYFKVRRATPRGTYYWICLWNGRMYHLGAVAGITVEELLAYFWFKVMQPSPRVKVAHFSRSDGWF